MKKPNDLDCQVAVVLFKYEWHVLRRIGHKPIRSLFDPKSLEFRDENGMFPPWIRPWDGEEQVDVAGDFDRYVKPWSQDDGLALGEVHPLVQERHLWLKVRSPWQQGDAWWATYTPRGFTEWSGDPKMPGGSAAEAICQAALKVWRENYDGRSIDEPASAV
jgi:hypothetical protein